jgi:hypothetical protein
MLCQRPSSSHPALHAPPPLAASVACSAGAEDQASASVGGRAAVSAPFSLPAGHVGALLPGARGRWAFGHACLRVGPGRRPGSLHGPTAMQADRIVPSDSRQINAPAFRQLLRL